MQEGHCTDILQISWSPDLHDFLAAMPSSAIATMEVSTATITPMTATTVYTELWIPLTKNVRNVE